MLNWLKQIPIFARNTSPQQSSEPSTPNHWVVYPRDAHNISRKDISDAALKVMYRLNSAGYEAYLVGGGVRDLLLGGHSATHASLAAASRLSTFRLAGKSLR